MAYLSTTNFSEDKDFIDKWLYTIRTGEMDLSWMNAVTEKISPEEANPRRGLTYRDLNLGSYGFTDIPEKVRANRSYAPRGAETAAAPSPTHTTPRATIPRNWGPRRRSRGARPPRRDPS